MSSDKAHIETGKQLVPELRFKDFDGESIIIEFDQLVNVIDCKHRTPPYVEVGVPLVSPGTIKWGEIDLISPTKRVSEAEYESLMDHCSPQEGDLVFSRNQSIGIASILKRKEKFVLGQDTVLIQATTINSIYVYYRIQTHKVQALITRLSGGSTFARINLSDLRKLKITVAKDQGEQQKIGFFLRSVDDKIQQLTKKKELLEQYKKGVTQQLFSRKLRFKPDGALERSRGYPDWEEKQLDEIAIKSSSNISANVIEKNIGKFKLYGASGLLKRIDFFREPEPFISIVKDGAGVGRTFLCESNSSVLGTLDVIKPNVQVVLYFLYSVLNNIRFEKYIVGSTIPHIYYKDYSHEKIKIPCFEEQQKIATYLSSIDTKIESVTNQITQTKTFKKGLLQQMFV